MKTATVISGLHKGRVGNIVSIPWLGNLWNLRLTLNVPATEQEIKARYGRSWGNRIGELLEEMKIGHGPREWIKVWRRQVSF